MKKAKEIKEELEKEHGWNFSSEENMEMYYELFLDLQKVVLRQPHVVGRGKQLPNNEKEKLINDAYWFNLQNLSGREDFQEAFKLGIMTGVDETLKKFQLKVGDNVVFNGK